VFQYFDGFLDDAGTVRPNAVCDLCSVVVDAVFCPCGEFAYRWLYSLSGVFRNLTGDLAARMADVHQATGADFVNAKF
jgi:hypothetical protein